MNISGNSILDDLSLLHIRGTDHLLFISPGVHEIKADFDLRVSTSTLRSELPAAGKRIVHVSNGVIHFGGCVRTCTSIKSW